MRLTLRRHSPWFLFQSGILIIFIVLLNELCVIWKAIVLFLKFNNLKTRHSSERITVKAAHFYRRLSFFSVKLVLSQGRLFEYPAVTRRYECAAGLCHWAATLGGVTTMREDHGLAWTPHFTASKHAHISICDMWTTLVSSFSSFIYDTSYQASFVFVTWQVVLTQTTVVREHKFVISEWTVDVW